MPEPMLRAILENPADDFPRLLASDWLEEHGECDRAEFIRIGCELAKGRLCGNSNPEGCRTRCAYCPKFDALLRRADELPAANEAEWVRKEFGLGKHFNTADQRDGIFYLNSNQWWPAKLIWHRGFISQVECRLADWRVEICQGCRGNKGEWDYGPGYAVRWVDCQTCHGTGRTPGLGAVLMRRAPIERVVVTDRKPLDLSRSPLAMRHGLKFVLGNESTRPVEGRLRESDQHFVPEDVWNLLKGVTFTNPHVSHRAWCWFESVDAARAALSDALIKLAREQMEPASTVSRQFTFRAEKPVGGIP